MQKICIPNAMRNSQQLSLSHMLKMIHQQCQFQLWSQLLWPVGRHRPGSGEQLVHTLSAKELRSLVKEFNQIKTGLTWHFNITQMLLNPRLKSADGSCTNMVVLTPSRFSSWKPSWVNRWMGLVIIHSTTRVSPKSWFTVQQALRIRTPYWVTTLFLNNRLHCKELCQNDWSIRNCSYKKGIGDVR